ncbi:MAG: DNA repair protein RecO (recombination protein O) [Saprospiraceae bacterium]|jgi:DNA repair protein RecO (recombination protein O)
MLIKTRGIIFRTKKYSETSVIADIYTEAKGLRSYLISGVRTKKSRVNPSLLQVMSLVELVVYHRDDKTLTRIKEIKPAVVFKSIPFNVQKGAVGLFIAEVARKTISESEENPALFDFIFDQIQFLDTTEQSIANLHLHFMTQLTAFLGFEPSGHVSEEEPFFDMQEGIFMEVPPVHPLFLNEELSILFSQLLEKPREQCHDIKMTRPIRKELLESILDFYALHIENFPKIYAHAILEIVMS